MFNARAVKQSMYGERTGRALNRESVFKPLIVGYRGKGVL